MDSPGKAGRSERAFSLVELLVALALLAVVAPIVLDLLTTTRRLFRDGDERIDLQQSVRAAHAALLRELLLTGLNADPDGNPARPDEAVEAAYDTALVLRADIDRGTADAADPEDALAGAGPFQTVSTGNDEIVGFALAKADAPNPDTLTFDADVVPVPRDGVVETISVGDVALAQAAPPYTLYRFTVKAGAQTMQRVPVIDGVRSLRFTYYDLAGAPLPAAGGGEAPGLRAARAAIRGIRVELVGMGRDSPALFGLRGEVRLRNAGPALPEAAPAGGGGT